jgi:hypothetical protein
LFAQEFYNTENPLAFSIPASEHSDVWSLSAKFSFNTFRSCVGANPGKRGYDDAII